MMTTKILLGSILFLLMTGCMKANSGVGTSDVTDSQVTSSVLSGSFGPGHRSDVNSTEDGVPKIPDTTAPTVKMEMKSDAEAVFKFTPREITAPLAVPQKRPESAFAIPTPQKNQLVETGTVTATVYFIAVVNEDTPECRPSDRVRMFAMNKTLLVCPKTLSFCANQGSCVIKKDNVWTTYNVTGRTDGHSRFAKITDGCLYGYGVSGICLDPFYSVAAELGSNLYTVGDVIFVPALRGKLLPNGQRHDGYLIVRDTGSDIKGRGRFDFYSGSMNWKHASNPFVRLGLNDRHTDLEYSKVSEDLALRVRQKRGYPKLPGQGLVEMALANGNTAGVPTIPL